MNDGLGKYLIRAARVWRKYALTREALQEANHYEQAMQQAQKTWAERHEPEMAASFATGTNQPEDADK